jgi:hypothetical protein
MMVRVAEAPAARSNCSFSRGEFLARLSVPTAEMVATHGYLKFPAHPILAIVTDLVVEAVGA